MKIQKIFFSLIFFLFTPVFAQESLKSIEEDYYFFLNLTGLVESPCIGYRTLSDSAWSLDNSVSHIWSGNHFDEQKILFELNTKSDLFTDGIFTGLKYKVFGPEWFNSYNTNLPYGQNDGALWQGSGFNTSFTTGLKLEGFGFELTLKPMLCFSQNKDFEIDETIYKNPYSYSFTKGVNFFIDYVQRYGDTSFFTFDWNDSEIRYSWKNLTLGFGTQSPWLGSAFLNPMLGSNNGVPYPKIDFGLRKTDIIIPKINYFLGSIEARIWTGYLKQSDYFYNDNNNTADRMINALSVGFNPSFISGFEFGANRVFVTRWQLNNLKFLYRLFSLDEINSLASSGNDEDQKCSLYINWHFPSVGFELFGEYGFDDFTSDNVTNPFHTGIYTAGIKQAIPLPFNLQSELDIELNDFEMSQDFQLQWPYMGFYGHGTINQGYTNKGQIIGAGSGALGNSQFIQYKVYYPKGYTLFFYHRYCPNNNAVYSQAVNNIVNKDNTALSDQWYANYETYSVWGLESNYFFKDFSITGSYCFLYISNRNYTYHNNSFSSYFKLDFKYNF